MSNSSSQYKVIFQGVVKGHNPDKVKQNLATLCKVAPEKLDPIFKKKSAVFKKTNDYKMALKYQAALRKAGALCTISGVKPVTPTQQEIIPQTRVMLKPTIVCAQCGTEQEKSTTCIRCGLEFQHYAKPQATQIVVVESKDLTPINPEPKGLRPNLTILQDYPKHVIFSNIKLILLALLAVVLLSINLFMMLGTYIESAYLSLKYVFLLPLVVTVLVWAITKNMTKAIGAFASISAVLIVLPFFEQAKEPPGTKEWQAFQENSGFSITLPDIPSGEKTEVIVEVEDSLDRKNILLGIHHFSLKIPDDMFFTVTYSELPEEVIEREGVQRLFDTIKYQTLSNDPYWENKYQSIEAPLQYKQFVGGEIINHIGKEFVIKNQEGYVRSKARLYLVDNKLYQISVGTGTMDKQNPNKRLPKDIADRFLTSFELTNTATMVADIAPEKMPFDQRTTATATTKLTGESKIEQLKKTTVYISVKGDKKTVTASGLFVHKTQTTAFIITTADLVHPKKNEKKQQISVTFNSGNTNELTLSAQIAGVNLSTNLAVLQVGPSWGLFDKLPQPVEIPKNTTRIIEEQEVRILGFASTNSQKKPRLMISKGIVSGIRKDENDQTALFQINNEVNSDNAGAPIVTTTGVVVGVVTSIHDQTNDRFVVPIRQANNMVRGTLTNIAVLEIQNLGSDLGKTKVELTLQAKQIDPLKNIGRASLILVHEQPKLLQKALLTDGSWQSLVEDDVDFPVFMPYPNKKVVKITLLQAPMTNYHYFGQVILTLLDGTVIYQPPFRLTLNLENSNHPIQLVGPGTLKDSSQIYLKTENLDIKTPPIEDIILAGGGKYLIAKFNRPQVGIFDIAAGNWVKMVKMTTTHLQIAANQDKLLIGLEGTNNLEIWDLKTFKYKTMRLPDNIKIKAMTLGWNSSNAPLLVFTSKSPGVVFFDINSFSRMNTQWKPNNRWGYVLRVNDNDQFSLQTSANGTTFTGRHQGYSNRSYIIQWHGMNASFLEKSIESYLAPSPKGNVLYTLNKGIVSLNLQPKGITFEGQHLIPGPNGQFFIAVENGREGFRDFMKVSVTIYRIANYHPVLTLDDLPEMRHAYWSRDSFYYQKRLTENKRYWLLPTLNKLVTIPYSNDKIKIREVNIEE